MKLNPAVSDLPISAVSGILQRAAREGWADALHMAGGEPRFAPPEGALDALDRGNSSIDALTKYSPFLGRGDLIDAIRHKLQIHNGVVAGPDEVICVPGGSAALLTALACCAEPGSEVLVQDPCWEHYLSIIRLAGCTPVRFRMTFDGTRYAPDLDHLTSVLSPSSRAILVNTPLNPCGSMLTQGECEALALLGRQRGLTIICDEEYEAFVYNGRRHVSPRRYDSDVVQIQSFSKSFALTGIRLAYICAPPLFVEAARRYALYSYMYPPSPSQAMALGALSGDWQSYLARNAQLYQSKMERLASRIEGLRGVDVPRPEGGLYLFPRFSGMAPGVRAADVLIEDYHLLCVPGEVAGEAGAGHVRLFFGIDDHLLDEAARRIGVATQQPRDCLVAQ